MRAKELNRTVTEVSMTPSDFAQAIEQGNQENVLIGFEFEVCVPLPTNRSINIKNFDTYLEETEYFEDTVVNQNNIDSVSKVFQFKPGVSPYPDFKYVYDNFATMKLDKIKELYQTLEPATRARFTDEAMSVAKDELNFALLFAKLLDRGAKNSREVIISEEMAELARSALRFSQNNGKIDMIELFTTAFPKLSRYNFSASKFVSYSPKELSDSDISDVDLVADYIEWSTDYDDDDEDKQYNKAAKLLKPQVEREMGRSVKVFKEYHQSTKNLKDWYIEPDGSLSPDSGDGSAEIVSPPLKANEAMTALKQFYTLASQLKLYTNKSTGLHINVSIPKKLDPMKLALFLGDEHVLKQFGREANHFAESVIKALKDPDQWRKVKFIDQDTNSFPFKVLEKVAKESQEHHTASISNNGKYISFRHAGGNYLADYKKVVDTVGRFVRAMLIASDPNAYRQEYLSKLSLLVNQRNQATTRPNNVLQAVTNIYRDILANGLVVLNRYAYGDVPPSKAKPAINSYFKKQDAIIQPIAVSELRTTLDNSTLGKEITNSYDFNAATKAYAISNIRQILSVPTINNVSTPAELAFLLVQYMKLRKTEKVEPVDIMSWRGELYVVQIPVVLSPSDPQVTEVLRALSNRYKQLANAGTPEQGNLS